MRDLLVTATVFGLLPFALSRPYVGIWLWSWLGYMNPHRLAWGFAYNFPFSQVVAITLFISLVVSKERQRIPLTALTILWAIFLAWMCVTTLFALYPVDAQNQLNKILKIQLMCFLTIVAIRKPQHLHVLLWVVVGSLCFYGIKGGFAMLLQGRSVRLYGPGGFIEDNNALAIAILMTIPILVYLASTIKSKYARLAVLASLFPLAVAIIGSSSRAAFLGAIGMAGLVWIRSQKKLPATVCLGILIPFALWWAPDSWYERIGTITATDEQGQYEGSAQSRLDTWNMIINLTKARPILGAGLDPWRQDLYLRYSDTFQPGDRAQAAHSVYFSILAEHGIVGLVLFFALFAAGWRIASRTIIAAEREPDTQWIASLMRMMQISIFGFLVAGAFHQLPYFDLPWHMLAIVTICQLMVRERARDQSVQRQSRVVVPQSRSAQRPPNMARGPGG